MRSPVPMGSAIGIGLAAFQAGLFRRPCAVDSLMTQRGLTGKCCVMPKRGLVLCESLEGRICLPARRRAWMGAGGTVFTRFGPLACDMRGSLTENADEDTIDPADWRFWHSPTAVQKIVRQSSAAARTIWG